jgi:CubicO group peptidase (beta-lactamase class C family)
MKQTIGLLLILSFLILQSSIAQTGVLERAEPESLGLPSKAIRELCDSLTSLPMTDIHSVMILRHGKVAAEMFPEPFAPEYRHTVYSCSKTLVGMAVGIAISEHRLCLDDRIAPYFTDVLPNTVSAHLAAMRIRDLLTMSSGIVPDWTLRETVSDWSRAWLAKPVQEPGRTFMYDSMSTYMLSAIIQKVSGTSLLDYLKSHVFNALGITEVEWEVSPEGYNTGGWGLHIQTESLAKIGLLLLNKGCWNGQQLIPAYWVEEMMKKQIDEGRQGYGYQMWPCEYPTAARLDGAYGQYVLIIPEKDMVVVITECTAIDGIRQRRLVWNRLMPQVAEEALPAAPKGKMSINYVLPYPEGKRRSAASFLDKTFELNPNTLDWKEIRLHREDAGMTLEVINSEGIRIPIRLGYRQWLKTMTEAKPAYSVTVQGRMAGISGPFVVAGSYAWKGKDALNIELHYVNWITSLEVRIAASDDDVKIEAVLNHAQDPIVLYEGKK